MQHAPIRISRRWFMLNLLGAALSAAGVWLQQGSTPALGSLLLAAGVPLMAVSILIILRRARRARPSHD